MPCVNENRTGSSFPGAAVIWLSAALLFWIAETLLFAVPELAVFGNMEILLHGEIADVIYPGMLIYLLVFLAIGLILQLAFRIAGISYSLPWHVFAITVFLFIYAGGIFVNQDIGPSMSIGRDVVWLIGLLGILVVAFYIFRKNKDRLVFSYSRIAAAIVFAVIWLLPLSYIFRNIIGVIFGAFTLFVYIALGFFLTILLFIHFRRKILSKTVPLFMSIGLATASGAIAYVNLYTDAASAGMDKMSLDGDRPNIVMIVLDTVRDDHLSVYGYDRPTTPTLEKLASEGVLFENVMSVSNWTLPSHATIFTGQYPGEHFATGLNKYLDNTYPTIAQILYRLGYQTAGFSANVMVSDATNLNRGFDYFWQAKKRLKRSRYTMVWVRWYLYFRNLDKKLDDGEKIEKRKVKRKGRHSPPAKKVRKAVVKWLKKSRDPEKPFFIFINLMDAHLPYGPPSHDDIGRFLPEDVTVDEALSVNDNAKAYIAGVVDMTQRDFDILEALYDAQIRYMDDELAKLFDTLDDLGLRDDTVVMVMSDHGEFFGENGFMGHTVAPRRATLSVPLVTSRLPGFEPGTRVGSLVQNTDFLPTLIDLLDVKGFDANLPGKSFLAAQAPRKGYAENYPNLNFIEIVSQYSPEEGVKYHRQTSVVWSNGYEYIWDTNGARELYFLPDDPDEEVNVEAAKPDVARRLEAEAEARAKRSTGEPEIKTEKELSPEDMERLRALGYIK